MLPLIAALALLLPVHTAQHARSSPASGRIERAEAETSQQIWIGCVCLPDGSPAAGAEVVTSAGGQAVTAADGTFGLELFVTPDAESVEVTAVLAGRGQESLVASVRIVPSSQPSTTSVGRLLLAPPAGCQPRWRPTFGRLPGVDGTVHAFAVYDDGGGPALHVGGSFATAGGVAASSVARWDGSSWSTLGVPSASANALTVHDDGGGSALYVGGSFTVVSGVAANRIAKWDGATWTPLGSGMDGTVFELAVYDDGSGPALHAAGSFTTAGSVTANQIAKWDGSSWAVTSPWRVARRRTGSRSGMARAGRSSRTA